MNFIIVISALTNVIIRGKIIYPNLDLARLARFEKRHALAEQVLSDANNKSFLNEMVEYKPDSFASKTFSSSVSINFDFICFAFFGINGLRAYSEIIGKFAWARSNK